MRSLDIDPMTLMCEFKVYFGRYTCTQKINFLCQRFRKLSYDKQTNTNMHTDRCLQKYYHEKCELVITMYIVSVSERINRQRYLLTTSQQIAQQGDVLS